MGTNQNIDLNIPPEDLHEDVFMSFEKPPSSTCSPYKNSSIHKQNSRGYQRNIDLNEISPPEIDLNDPPPYEDENEFTNKETISQTYEEPEHIQFDTSELLSSEDEEEVLRNESVRKLKMLTNEKRYAIYAALLQRSMNGKLKKNDTRDVASFFSVSMRTVQRIWKRSLENFENGVANVSHRKTKNCGRKRIELDMEIFRNIPLQQRTTIRSTASAMNVNMSLIYRNMQSGRIKRHTNALKPFLTEQNKKARIHFCLSMFEDNSLPHDPTFKHMYNVIHVDEKWFNMSRKNEKYYILPDEEEPYRTCKSKNFVAKVMFLAAIARPRFDEEGNVKFSGKIGIFPFVTKEPAKRSSVNRIAGTMETKAMTSVKRDTVRSYFIHKLLPAIFEKWPREEASKPIIIQQDNARTHIDPNDPEFCQAAQQYGFNIKIMCQPPNSPDLNVLDLGFFRAIQSLKYQEASRTINELVIGVEKAFETFSVIKSDHIFLSLQLCMQSVLEEKGGNNYKIKHISKDALRRRGLLPLQMKCDAQLIQNALTLL